MLKIIYPQKVKLIVGIITNNCEVYDKAKMALRRRFGACDYESPQLEFRYTDYYEKELGKGLKRYFLSFKRLISPDKLASIKIITNSIEKKFLNNNRRIINIDPGYLNHSKLILATTKDYSHRIYLKKGIYAEVTLRFKDNTFAAWDWTYPDYQTQDYINIFNNIRQMYIKQIKCPQRI